MMETGKSEPGLGIVGVVGVGDWSGTTCGSPAVGQKPWPHLAELAEVGVEVAQRGELAGEPGLDGGLEFAAGVEIAPAELIGESDDRGAHRTILVGALRPRQFFICPEI